MYTFRLYPPLHSTTPPTLSNLSFFSPIFPFLPLLSSLSSSSSFSFCSLWKPLSPIRIAHVHLGIVNMGHLGVAIPAFHCQQLYVTSKCVGVGTFSYLILAGLGTGLILFRSGSDTESLLSWVQWSCCGQKTESIAALPRLPLPSRTCLR